MNTVERLKRVDGSISIHTEYTGPWMSVTLHYSWGGEHHWTKISMASLNNLETLVSVLLDEVDAMCGIYEPQTVEA